ncbi:MAG: DUF4381 family protein [Deltaproteobacteria bacterium]|nr:DUF4381 family protein [Deltaproteobacteria bacterium]
MVRSRTASYHYRTVPSLISAVFVSCFISWLLFFIQACGNKTGIENTQNNTVTGIHKKIEKGSVSVTIDTDKREITVAERLTLTVSAACSEDWEINLPGIDEKFGQFVIVDYHTTRPELSDQKQKTISRSYLLEPFLAGEYTIPPITIGFRKDGETVDITTPEININVASLLPENKTDYKIHDIQPPLKLPFSLPIWVYAVCFAVIAILIVLSFFVFRRRRLQTIKEIKVDPGEIALRELEALVSEKLEEKGETKRLYHGVSNILRRYIERCFGIHAPEQTTEEFLAGLEKGSRFPDKYNRLLKTFLRYCDLVKFAEHQPQRDDIQNAFGSCREFIHGSREKEQ